MKKLILCVLLATSMCFAHIPTQQFTFIHKHMHRSLPTWPYNDDAVIPVALTIAAWSAKYTDYFFDQYEENAFTVTYRVHNDDCAFVVRFNRLNRLCSIDYDVVDDSFDYNEFVKIIDFFFAAD